VKHTLTDKELRSAAALLAFELKQERHLKNCWPLTRNAMVAAYILQQFTDIRIVDDQDEADFYLGVECSVTPDPTVMGKPYRTFFGPFEMRKHGCDGFILPWQTAENAEGLVAQQLKALGDDPEREGLRETPSRVVKAWNEWFGGYKKDPKDVFKTFGDGGENYDEMVTVRDIPFYSHCEHHMAPFFGTVTIAYIPNKKIIGLSKLVRLVEVFARRLQVQERITTQIVEAMVEHLAPLGVGVAITARHMCMESRGIKKQGTTTLTTALRGAIRDDPAVKAEFMRMVK
jgi:GTP cyclohydrolase I